MKKNILIIVFLLFSSNKLKAQTINFFDNSGNMTEYNIADIQKLKFYNNGSIYIYLNDGEAIHIPSEEFRNYQYNQNVLDVDDFNSSIKDLELYPNPTQNLLRLSFTSQSSFPYSYIIYDISGRKVADKKIGLVSGSYTEQVSLAKFSSGAYFLVLKSGKNKISKKIIKK